MSTELDPFYRQWLCPPIGKTRNNLLKCSMSTIPSSDACWVPRHSPAFLGCSRELDGLLTHHLVPGFLLSSTRASSSNPVAKISPVPADKLLRHLSYVTNQIKEENRVHLVIKILNPGLLSKYKRISTEMVSTKTHPTKWAIITNVKWTLTWITQSVQHFQTPPHI